MIAPSTVFLLQFAKYRPECARKITASAPVAVVAPNPPERWVSPLLRLLGLL